MSLCYYSFETTGERAPEWVSLIASSMKDEDELKYKLIKAIASVNEKKEELAEILPANLETPSVKAKLDQLNVSHCLHCDTVVPTGWGGTGVLCPEPPSYGGPQAVKRHQRLRNTRRNIVKSDSPATGTNSK